MPYYIELDIDLSRYGETQYNPHSIKLRGVNNDSEAKEKFKRWKQKNQEHYQGNPISKNPVLVKSTKKVIAR